MVAVIRAESAFGVDPDYLAGREAVRYEVARSAEKAYEHLKISDAC